MNASNAVNSDNTPAQQPAASLPAADALADLLPWTLVFEDPLHSRAGVPDSGAAPAGSLVEPFYTFTGEPLTRAPRQGMQTADDHGGRCPCGRNLPVGTWICDDGSSVPADPAPFRPSDNT